MSKYDPDTIRAYYALLLLGYDYAPVSAISGIPITTLKSWKQLSSRKNLWLHREVGEGQAAFISKHTTDSMIAQVKIAQAKHEAEQKEERQARSKKMQEAKGRTSFAAIREKWRKNDS